jgi:RNA recognition motif-containing protein
MEQKLYIGNLSYRATEGDVRKYLSKYGPIYSVILVYDSETGYTRGYGFVELEYYAAEAVLRDLNDTMFLGRNLKIRRAIGNYDYGQHPQRRYAENPASAPNNGNRYRDAAVYGGNFEYGEYGDFTRKDFKGLLINGKYYKIDHKRYGLYQSYKFKGSKMNYSGPSNTNPADEE